MKKCIIRALAAVLCAITLVFSLASCSKQPYDYKLSDYITVPKDLDKINVTHEEILAAVDAQIKSLLENKATLVTAENNAASKSGDILKISFKCYTDEDLKQEIAVLSDDDCMLSLQAVPSDTEETQENIAENIKYRYPKELQEELLGKKLDGKFAVWVTLPKSFTAINLADFLDKDSKESSSKPQNRIYYVGKITEIKTPVLPEYNDEFVKSVSEYQTVEEYESYLYERMKEELIFDKLAQASTVKHYPVDEVQAYTESFTKYYTEKAEALKITLEQYVAKKFFINMTDFHLKADTYAKGLVKDEMLLYTLSRRYKIELTDEQYSDGAQKYVKEYGLSKLSELEAKFGTEYVRRTVLMDKVLEYLASKVTVQGEPEASPAA